MSTAPGGRRPAWSSDGPGVHDGRAEPVRRPALRHVRVPAGDRRRVLARRDDGARLEPLPPGHPRPDDDERLPGALVPVS